MKTIKSDTLFIVGLSKHSAIFQDSNDNKYFASTRIANKILRGQCYELVVVTNHYQDRDINWLGLVTTV